MFQSSPSLLKTGFKSTCEDELNCLTQEIEWALKKRRQDSQTEINKLKSALSEYKKKYDSCRLKQKELINKHEDLKAQFSNLDQHYQDQLTTLQKEVCEMKNSFQLMLADKASQNVKQTKNDKSASQEIVKLKGEAERWSTLVEELRAQNQAQEQKQKDLQTSVHRLKAQLKQKEDFEARETDQHLPQHILASSSSRLAERAQERFLREEAVFQEGFRGNLLAKLERLKAKMAV